MKVHFIAIGGSAMHNLALALHDKGFQVTGSDDKIIDPARSRLEKAGILPPVEGWFPDKVTAGLDCVILGMHARADNPELLKARELGVPVYSYPEYIYQQSINKKRVVIGGSHGKTTITAMVMHALRKAGKDFDYLVGAQLEGFNLMVKLSDAPVIIIEGDEYLASAIDRRPKFHLYKAHIGLISGVAWDHINVFPTREEYENQFALFAASIEQDGTLVYNAEEPVLAKIAYEEEGRLRLAPYRVPEYRVENGHTYLEDGRIELQIFGRHNLSNLEGARAVCQALGVAKDDFYRAMQDFTGAAKRLEVIGRGPAGIVFKDFAHSPSKVKATIAAVKEQYAARRLYACVELHTFSSLNKGFLAEYANALDGADEAVVFIDAEVMAGKGAGEITAAEIKEGFAREDLLFITDPAELRNWLEKLNADNANILIMTSGGLGGIKPEEVSAVIIRNTLTHHNN